MADPYPGSAGADRLEQARLRVEQLRELAAAQPDRYRPNLAAALCDEGIRLFEVGRADEARRRVTEADRIVRRLFTFGWVEQSSIHVRR